MNTEQPILQSNASRPPGAAGGRRAWAAWILFGVVAAGAFAMVEIPYHNEATRQLLIEASKDEDRVQRVRAVRALALANDTRNAAEIARSTKDAVDAVKREAMAGLPKPLPEATSDAFQPRPRVSTEQSVENHRDPRVRQAARLRQLDAASSQPDFSRLLDDPDYFVRRAVSAQVVKSRGASSLPVWKKLLASEKLDDRVEAAWAVGQLDSKADEGALVDFLASDSERLRLIAIESLQTMGGDTARAALGSHIEKQKGKTLEALLRLAAKIEARPALPTLRSLAGNSKAPLPARALALDAIHAMADAESKPLLLKLVQDYDISATLVREHSAMALGLLGGPEAIPPLKKLVSEKVLNMPMIGPVYDGEGARVASILALEQLKAGDVLKSFPEAAFMSEAGETMRRVTAEVLTRVTGTAYDYRRAVTARSYFIQSLGEVEYPADLSANLKKPPVFPK